MTVYCIQASKLHCVSKNVPPLTCYNLDTHSSTAIISGICTLFSHLT